MSKKGANKKSKALSSAKAIHVNKKEKTWIVKTRAGPHKEELAVPLAIILRDYLHLAENLSEAKKILSRGEVKVNGVIRKEHQYGAGLFDLIEIEKQKLSHRIVLDQNGRLKLKELPKKSSEKMCRVEHKHVTAKGAQLTTNDGRVIFGTEAKVGDSLKLRLPEGKVEKVLPLKAGAQIYVMKGIHCAEKGTVKELVPATQTREKLVKFMKNGKEYETVARNAFVIGEKEVEMEELK